MDIGYNYNEYTGGYTMENGTVMKKAVGRVGWSRLL